MPTSISSIDAYAFYDCSNLEEIVMENFVPCTLSYPMYLGNNTILPAIIRVHAGALEAYQAANGWKDMDVQTYCNIKYISTNNVLVEPTETGADPWGNGAKLLCNYIHDGKGYLEFEEGTEIAKIPENAFKNCFTLSSIEFPSTVTAIGANAFYDCLALTSVSNLSSVTTIGDRAFYNCQKLVTFNFPSGLKEVGVYAFRSCNHLNDYEFPQGLETIGKGAFYGCKTPATLVIPAAITTIPEEAFQLCPSLKTVSMPNVTKIGLNAFSRCSSLETVTIPTCLTEVAAQAFYASAIKDVYYEGTIDDWCGITFADKDANPLVANYYSDELINLCIKNSDDEYEAQTDVTISRPEISDYALCHSSIQSLTLDGVTKIGTRSFSYCYALKTINVGANLAALGTDAFNSINENYVVNVPLAAYTTYAKTNGWKELNLVPLSGTIALTDAEGYEIDQDVLGCNISYTRTVSNDNWMGVYLPFDVTVTEVGTYATLESVSEGYLNWTTLEEGATIQACTPFIYKPMEFEAGEESRNITFSATAAQLHSCEEEHPVADGGYILNGNFTEITTMKSLGAYALASNVFKQADDNNKHLKSFRVYIVANGASHAPALRNRIDGEDVTGIEDIVVNGQCPNGQSFNLQGIRVDDSYKGIVIVNGKKVLRK